MENEIVDQQKADELHFAELAKVGCVFSNERDVDFFFMGTKNSLIELGQELVKKGFTPSENQTKPEGLLFIKKMSLDLTEMQNLTSELVKLSRQYGVDYDGWGCVA